MEIFLFWSLSVWNLFSEELPLKYDIHINTLPVLQWSCSVSEIWMELTLPTSNRGHMIPDGPIRAPLPLAKVLGLGMGMWPVREQSETSPRFFPKLWRNTFSFFEVWRLRRMLATPGNEPVWNLSQQRHRHLETESQSPENICWDLAMPESQWHAH